MSHRKKTVFLADTTMVTLNKDCQYTFTTMIMKFWLYNEHIFVDVLNQNDRKCDGKLLDSKS